jgi:hypothetical protein
MHDDVGAGTIFFAKHTLLAPFLSLPPPTTLFLHGTTLLHLPFSGFSTE